MIKAIIFDWGGTCTKGRIKEVVIKNISQKFSISLKKADMAYEKWNIDYLLGKISGPEFWKNFSEMLGIECNFKKLNMIFLKSPKVNKNVLSLIKKLRRNYKTGLLSDSYREMAGYIVKKYRLGELFDAMVFSNDVGIKKPDKRIFDFALKRLHVDAGECIFIDDIKINTDSAKKYGFRSIRFKGSENLKSWLKKMGIRF